MNHNCHGQFFTAQGVSYYCCALDSAVTTEPVSNGEVCHNCQRPMIGMEETVSAIEVQVTTVARMRSGAAVILQTETRTQSE